MIIHLPTDFSLEIFPHARPTDDFLDRLLDFYHLQPAPTLSPMWHAVIAAFEKNLQEALASKNRALVGDLLCSAYGSSLVWGMDDKNEGFTVARWHERLMRLVNSIGLRGLSNPEQPATEELSLQEALALVDEHFGRKVGRPGGGGMLGLNRGDCVLTGKYLEALTTLTTLKRLPCWPPHHVLEIGAGLGFLAAAILTDSSETVYHTVDLPIVSVIQAYLLGLAFGPDKIWLDGEPWAGLHRIFIHGTWPKRQFQAYLALNQDSMPEMPHHIQDDYAALLADLLLPGCPFISINHETTAGDQRSVHRVLRDSKTFKLTSRQPYWGRDGYVLEIWERK